MREGGSELTFDTGSLLRRVFLWGDKNKPSSIINVVSIVSSDPVLRSWIIKDVAFPDRSWQTRLTILGGINAFISVLGWYWVFGWLLISGRSQRNYPLPANAWFCLCLTLCILGVAIMITADAQKYFTLRLQPGLITDEMFRYIRHPNYLGEMMIYGSFALMVWHCLPFVVLAWVYCCQDSPISPPLL
jgi:protein-S-isoprenylcysteine O-methyltransferase Ste14